MKTETNVTKSADQKWGLKALSLDTRGLSTVEYIILLVAVVVGCIGLWSSIGKNVHEQLAGADTVIADKVKPAGTDE